MSAWRNAVLMSQVKHDHVLDNIITSSTLSVTSVGVLANRVSWSMFSWKHPRAVSLHLTVFAVFQRFTHLQSSAESMSSCEHCSIGTSSYTSNSFMLFISFCIPSMTSSSGNSGSVLNSWGSFSLISVCFSSVSSFTATGTSVPSFKVTEKTPVAAIVSRLSSGSKSSGSSWFSAVRFSFLTLVSGGSLVSVSVVSSVSSLKSSCVSVTVSWVSFVGKSSVSVWVSRSSPGGSRTLPVGVKVGGKTNEVSITCFAFGSQGVAWSFRNSFWSHCLDGTCRLIVLTLVMPVPVDTMCSSASVSRPNQMPVLHAVSPLSFSFPG